jgi:hypothetical protein
MRLACKKTSNVTTKENDSIHQEPQTSVFLMMTSHPARIAASCMTAQPQWTPQRPARLVMLLLQPTTAAAAAQVILPLHS